MMPFDRCINLGPSFELSSASDVFTFKYRNWLCNQWKKSHGRHTNSWQYYSQVVG
jgi:hypothetical protein